MKFLFQPVYFLWFRLCCSPAKICVSRMCGTKFPSTRSRDKISVCKRQCAAQFLKVVLCSQIEINQTFPSHLNYMWPIQERAAVVGQMLYIFHTRETYWTENTNSVGTLHFYFWLCMQLLSAALAFSRHDGL